MHYLRGYIDYLIQFSCAYKGTFTVCETVLDVQLVTMLTSTSCTTAWWCALYNIGSHTQSCMECHHMRTHSLSVTAHFLLNCVGHVTILIPAAHSSVQLCFQDSSQHSHLRHSVLCIAMASLRVYCLLLLIQLLHVLDICELLPILHCVKKPLCSITGLSLHSAPSSH